MTEGTDLFDAWFPRIARAASFLVGLAILAYSALDGGPDRPWLYGAAVTLIVPPAAGRIERMLRSAGAGK